MLELLTNAWQGFEQYRSGGKYIALLLTVLLFLWFGRKENKQKVLLIYTTLVTVMCIFPVSAVFLMTYQTRYYDYVWIWNYVPVTLMIAYGGTIFLTEGWEHYKKSVWKCVGITVALLALLVLCGNLGQEKYTVSSASREKGEAEAVLAVLAEEAKGQDICLLAPKEIMAEARAYDGRIRLIYGRNIWDAALGGYSYETYSKAQEDLYLWMSEVEETGELNGIQAVEVAREAGVNRILLPDNMEAGELQQLSDVMDTEVTRLGSYYLLKLEK